jgi:hypothetical protein
MTRTSDVAFLVPAIFGYSLDAQIRPPRTPQALAEFSGSIEVPAEFLGLNPGLIAGGVI